MNPRSPRTQPQLAPGTAIDDRFHIEAFVAEGGMGSIYRARSLKRDGVVVALKIMRPQLASDTSAVTRFKREIEAVSLLQSQHTVRLFDFGISSEGLLFLAMEWLHGCNLAEHIHHQGPLEPAAATRYAVQAARALIEAHDKGIIHRDLKLENLFLVHDASGEPQQIKVLDFGLAKMVDEPARTQITRLGSICGTPEYMSPEQARAEALDGRSDVYALGCVLYAMLTGGPPFTHPNPIQVIGLHHSKPMPHLPVHLPAELDHIIQRATAKQREDRYSDMHEMLSLLEHFDAHAESASVLANSTAPTITDFDPSAAMSKPHVGPTQRNLRAQAPRLALAAGLAVLVVVALVWGLSGEDPAPETGEVEPSPESTEVPRVTVQVGPVDCVVLVDGQGQAHKTPLVLENRGGLKHTLEIIPTDKAYAPQTFELNVPGGVEKTVAISLGRSESGR